MTTNIYDNNDETFHKLGHEIADLLDLKRNRTTKRYDTTWGDKTPIGLGKVIYRIVERHQLDLVIK